MMLILCVSLLIGIIYLNSKKFYGNSLLLILLSVFLGFFIFIYSIACFVNINDTYVFEAKREAIEFSAATLSTDGEFEHLSLDKEILSFNKSLASYKKWNKTIWFHFSINNSIDDMEYINYREITK